jgi:histidine triad (HIT) family protein
VENCLFCQIGKGETPRDLVYSDEEIVAFRDIHPQAPIHILIVPKKHLKSINEIEQEDELLMGKLLMAAKIIALSEHVAASGYRLLINNGADSGQTIEHLHMHLMGGKKL